MAKENPIPRKREGKRAPESGVSPVSREKRFPFPCPDFDPLREPDNVLAQYGLPGRPDRRTQPELFAAWHRLFERPLKFVAPAFHDRHDDLRQPEDISIGHRDSRFATSRNWSGASVLPSGGRQFVLILGEWRVPKPSVPSQCALIRQSKSFHCSTWIGLDGARRYVDASLPQVGTRQIVSIGPDGSESTTYAAWIQWWARHQKRHNLRYISSDCIRVCNGMTVIAMVWAIDPFCVAIAVRNFPDNHITIEVLHAPEVAPERGDECRIPRISGATAEWIMERPSQVSVQEPTMGFPLESFADYGSVTFSHCVAGTALAPGPATSEQTLGAPRLFRMYDVPCGDPPRSRFISIPSKTGPTSIRVDYGGLPN
jgi:hypothetical protein